MAAQSKQSCSLWDTTNSLFSVFLLTKEIFACLYFGRRRLLEKCKLFVLGFYETLDHFRLTS